VLTQSRSDIRDRIHEIKDMAFSLIFLICIKYPSKAHTSRERVHELELYQDPGRGSLHKNNHLSGLHPGFSYDGLHLPCDVVEAVVGRGWICGMIYCLKALTNRLQLFTADIPVASS